MKKLLLFVILSCVSANTFAQLTKKALSEQFVNHLAASHWDSAIAMFDESLKGQLTPVMFEQIWGGLAGQLGKFQKIESSKSIGNGDVYDVSAGFDKGSIDFRCPFNDKNLLTGFFIPAPPRLKNPTPLVYLDAPYTKKDQIDDQEITVQTGEFKMPGTYTFPKNSTNFPVVILVHGSGPNDRDETYSQNKIFRDLAKGLASMGIASIRYDKRTQVHGAKLNIKTLTIREEVIEDVNSAIVLAKTLKGVNPNKIIVAGHSLGAMVAPQIATENPSLAGIVMLAGNARPLGELLVEQYEYLTNIDGKLTEVEAKMVDQIKKQVAFVNSKDLKPDSENLPLGLSGNYWISLNAYNQVKTAQALKTPMLIMQGENDKQVTVTDYAIWQRSLKDMKNVSFKYFTGLNHFFVPGSVPSDYDKKAFLPLDIVTAVATWVAATPESAKATVTVPATATQPAAVKPVLKQATKAKG